MKWFKFYGEEFLADMKISQLSIAERLLWVTILCIASSEEKEGHIPFCTESLLKSKMGLLESDVEWKELEGVLDLLKNMNMIEFTETGIFVKNFQKRQDRYLTPAEKMSKYRGKLNKSNERYIAQVTKVTPNRLEQNRIDKKNTPVSQKSGSPLKSVLHTQVIELFDFYKSKFNEGISDKSPIFNWATCEKLSRPHIKKLGLERMKELVSAYLESDDQFYKKNGWDLQTFLTARIINALHVNTKS